MEQQEKTNRSELMRTHIAACKASGKTVEDYCKEHELKPSNYYYWRKKLQPSQEPGKFISITPLLANAPVRISFTNGIHISFETMPPVDYIKQLVS
jgi:transposase-like protein